MPFDATLTAYLRHAGTEVRSFNQSAGWKALPQPTRDRFTSGQPDDLRPSEGYCRGAAIDWLRRALVRGKPAMNTGHEKGPRVERMVAAWQQPYQAERAAPVQRNERLKAELRGAGATVTEKADGRIGWTYATSKETEVQAVQQRHEAAEAKVKKEGALAEVWEEQARALDATYRSKSGLGKGFSDLYILASRGKGEKYDGFRDFVSQALYMKAFAPGTGMLLGVNLDAVKGGHWERSTGHAIALLYESEASLMLFDPNLGIYSFRQHEKLANAVAALFEYGYTDDKCRPSATEAGGDCYVFASLGGTLAHPALREAWAQDATRTAVPAMNTAASARSKAHCMDDFEAFRRQQQADEIQRRAAARAEAVQLLRAARAVFDPTHTTPAYLAAHNRAHAVWKQSGMSVAEAQAILPDFDGAVYKE